MSETSIPPPAVVARPSKPVSETLLNEKVRTHLLGDLEGGKDGLSDQEV